MTSKDVYEWLETWLPDMLTERYGHAEDRAVPRAPVGYSRHLNELPQGIQDGIAWRAADRWLRHAIKHQEPPSFALCLSGPTGTGKTSVICALWYALPAITFGYPLGYWPARALTEHLRAPGEPPGERVYRRKSIAELPQLCIDDLGAESQSQWDTELMQTLIEERHDLGLATFITTNLGIDELFNRYGHRTIDRLLSRSRLIPVTGESGRGRA